MPDYTILLIDYEPRSLERSRRPLATAGYRVEIARDGLAGMEAFERIKPDLVLVEAMIPKKHGFEVCQDLKKTPQGKRTPVLITTAVYKGRKYRSQALHLYGCDEYLEKPLPEEQLVTICARFLGDEDVAGRLARLQGLSDPAPQQAPAQSSVPPAAPPERTRAEEAEEEILARLDAILPGSSDASSDEPEIEIVLDEPNAAHRDAPRASVEPAQQVISLDEARARKRHKKGRGGAGRSGRSGGGGAAANPEPSHSVASEPVAMIADQPMLETAPSPLAETRLLPDPLPLPDLGSQAGLPGWVWGVAVAGLLGVILLLWLMLS